MKDVSLRASGGINSFFDDMPFCVLTFEVSSGEQGPRLNFYGCNSFAATFFGLPQDKPVNYGSIDFPFVARLDGDQMIALKLTVIECASTRSSFTRRIGDEWFGDITFRPRQEGHHLLVDVVLQNRNRFTNANADAHTYTHTDANAEVKLRETVLKNVLSLIPHAVFWKDRNSVYLGCNDRFLKDANLTHASDIIGKTDFEMPWGASHAELYRTYDAELMESGRAIVNLEETQLQADGSFIHVVTSKVPILDSHGVVIGVLGTYIDISELRHAQNNLSEQANKLNLVSKMAALGEMASGIAHEINNPLAIISMLTDVVIDELEDLKDAKLQSAVSNLRLIDQTTERIAKIVSGLRSFSRNEGTDLMKEHSLAEIFTTTLAFSGDKFKKAAVELRVPVVNGDLKLNCRATEISQVILNLLNNAHDAVVESKGKNPWVQLVVETTDLELQIEVRDSGPGIPDDLRDRIFEPFFTTKRVGKGTGLGLSISAGLIAQHRGRLKYDPVSGVSRFVIVLPRHVGDAKVAS